MQGEGEGEGEGMGKIGDVHWRTHHGMDSTTCAQGAQGIESKDAKTNEPAHVVVLVYLGLSM